MKKLIFTSIMVLISICSYAVPVMELRPGMECVLTGNTYEFNFVMPDFHIEIDTIESNLGSSYFSSIHPDTKDYFDYLGEDGLPELPFYSMNLLLPPDVEHIEVRHLHVIDSVIVTLPFDYTPAQEREDFRHGFSYDEHYYSHAYDPTWYGQYYTMDESNYRGQMGLAFSFYPAHYHPEWRKLVIITKAEFEIAFDGTNLYNHIDGLYGNLDLSLFNFFDNLSVDYSLIPPIHGDKYLIISADQWVNNHDLLDFVYHKESLGYGVTLTALHEVGYTPSAIRAYIQSRYRANGIKYVLLVGDVQDLPFSDGIPEDESEPPTDIFYACLSKDDVSDQWKDLNPSVFLGRWPIRDSHQLTSIVHKTIESDLHLGEGNPRKIGIFSGDEKYFYTDGKYVYDNIVVDLPYYIGDLFDGRYLSGSGYYVMKNYLSDPHCPPTWMFVYTGHGSHSGIASPYDFYYNIIDGVHTSALAFQSFGFGFACFLGDIYETKNFARSWMTSSEGGVTFLGATTTTYYNPDRYFSRKLFMQLENKPIMTIGEFVGNGKAQYYNADKVVYRRREAKKYVLYGDPSLYLFGLDIQYEVIPRRIHSSENNSGNNINNDNIIIDNSIDVINREVIKSVYIYSTSGQLMYVGDSLPQNTPKLPAGVYIAIINTENEQIPQKMIVN